MIRIDFLAELLLVTCAVPANLYVLFYAFRPFWLTPQGRALMTKAIGNAILIDLGLSVVLFGEDYTLRPYVRVAGFTVFAAGIWYLFFALLLSDTDGRYPPATWARRLRRRRDERPTHQRL